MCRTRICFSRWYSVLDAALGFLRIHCTYDVICCFQWWSILHITAVIYVWAIRLRVRQSAMFLSNNILIVYVTARMLSECLDVGFIGRVGIELVFCAGTPGLWLLLASCRIGELLAMWNMLLVCYKLFVQQDLSPCSVLVLLVASVVEARCRWYYSRGVMQYYSQMS